MNRTIHVVVSADEDRDAHPPRKLQSEGYTGPIHALELREVPVDQRAAAEEGVSLRLPSGELTLGPGDCPGAHLGAAGSRSDNMDAGGTRLAYRPAKGR